jgi:hypothetical protein
MRREKLIFSNYAKKRTLISARYHKSSKRVGYGQWRIGKGGPFMKIMTKSGGEEAERDRVTDAEGCEAR